MGAAMITFLVLTSIWILGIGFLALFVDEDKALAVLFLLFAWCVIWGASGCLG